jgi:hypothetical protein
MAKPDDTGNSRDQARADAAAKLDNIRKPAATEAAQDKPNKGQDEKVYTFLNVAGASVEGTMREYREKFKAEGYTRREETDDAKLPVTVDADGAEPAEVDTADIKDYEPVSSNPVPIK